MVVTRVKKSTLQTSVKTVNYCTRSNNIYTSTKKNSFFLNLHILSNNSVHKDEVYENVE